jgi:hypothetical protein
MGSAFVEAFDAAGRLDNLPLVLPLGGKPEADVGAVTVNGGGVCFTGKTVV